MVSECNKMVKLTDDKSVKVYVPNMLGLIRTSNNNHLYFDSNTLTTDKRSDKSKLLQKQFLVIVKRSR